MKHTISIIEFNWSIGNGESYLVVDGQLDEDFFSQDVKIMDGELLKNNIEDSQYYLIFADLKAFPKNGNVKNIETYAKDSGFKNVKYITDENDTMTSLIAW